MLYPLSYGRVELMSGNRGKRLIGNGRKVIQVWSQTRQFRGYLDFPRFIRLGVLPSKVNEPGNQILSDGIDVTGHD